MLRIDAILSSNRLCGLEVHVAESGMSFRAVVLQKMDNQIKILQRLEASTLRALKTEIGTKTPLVVVMSGKGILLRKVQPSSSEKQAFQSALPSGTQSDFFIQQHPLGWIALVKKGVRQQIIDNLKENGFRILDCALPLEYVGESMKALEIHNLTANGLRYQLNDQDLSIADHPEDQVQNIGEESLNSSFTGAFLLALMHLTGAIPKTDFKDEWEDERYRKLTTVVGVGVIAVLFVMLLGNLFVYQSHQEKHAILVQESRSYQTLFSQLDTLRKEVDSKQFLIGKAGLDHRPRNAEYADFLAESVPSDIKLDLLHIAPLDRKIRSDKPCNLDYRSIEVSGFAANAGALNEWMNALKDFDFLERVELRSYERSGKSKGSFELALNLQ